MKVKRLKMQSFRGIGDLTLEFNETEPIVLIGINGVGKSSILDCLAILLSQITGSIQNSVDAIRSFHKQDITNGGKDTRNEITVLLELREFTWSLNQIQNEVRKNLSSLLASLITTVDLLGLVRENESIKITLEEKLGQSFNDLSIKLEVNTISDLPEQLRVVVDELRSQIEADPKVNLPLAVYYPVNRAVLDIPLEIAEKYEFKQIDSYEQSLTGGKIDFKSFFEWFRNREDLENELRRDNLNYRDRQLESVRGAITSLQPEFSDLRVERLPLRMTVIKRGQELIINQLSDGEKCLLAMVGDLARRLAIANPSLPDPLQGSGVVLIDEIELHLHPKWQREIIPALTRTFPNCQFIVTTHSPQVISQVKPEGIYILEKTDNGVVAKRPESSFGRDSNRILEDLMGVPARPQEIKDRLHELFRLIDEGNLDGARQLSQEIADIIGQDEPELVKASVSIRRKEILKR
ncbi:MAG: AAA family ATPase [Nostoc sp. NOS(2021)]|uniref:AAA family ATPase n=1 Tax=Nostoc sp. NOS(2021) TaxID=2815407 RepID=UPI0025CBEC3A|nr:AAA family ATPase [Nostoc sp. NOS(2021)]MBN3897535.1 AAA family ATPase [Nostoc sp. NOS(2021)]